MKSFQEFLNERRSEEIQKLRGEIKTSEYDDVEDWKKEKKEIESAREKLKQTPTLTDDEMRQQNPKATAAYEDDVKKRKKVDPKKVSVTQTGTGEWEITNKPETPSSTSRTSTRNKPKTPRNITTPSGRLTSSVPVAPKSQNINLGDTSLPKTSKAPKVSPLSVSAPAPRMTPDSVGKAFDQVLQNREARKAAEKAKGALKFAKAVKGAGTALSIVGSGIEAKGGYETARREGASQRRALGAGAARGLGSFIGGGVGAAAGSVLGLPGAIAGGAAGYGLGANVGTAAYKAVTGDIKKKLTTQGLKTNIRKAVPYEIRKQVPAGARKAFGDFITQAGKQYGKWQKSQQQQGGNK